MEAEPHPWAGSLDDVINLSFSFQGQKGDPGLSPGKARNGQKVRCCPECTGVTTTVRFKGCAYTRRESVLPPQASQLLE